MRSREMHRRMAALAAPSCVPACFLFVFQVRRELCSNLQQIRDRVKVSQYGDSRVAPPDANAGSILRSIRETAIYASRRVRFNLTL